MTWTRWRRVRQAVQWLFLALYLYLLLTALQRRAAFPLADLFFRLDPLVAGSAMLAAKSMIARLLPALLIVALTLTLGRVWCGWLCPLGTVLDLARLRRGRNAAKTDLDLRHPFWRQVKYVLLFFIIGLALFGSLALLILDPITILTRTITVTLLPMVNRLVTGVLSGMYALPALRGVVDAIEGAIRGPILPVRPAVFAQNALIGVFFLGILGLNLVAHRFWCRYLCPLGALLALLARVSFLRRRITASCNQCAACTRACEMEAIHADQAYEADPAECTVCLDCLASCRKGGIAFRPQLALAPVQVYNPSRRQFLAALGGAVAGVALLDTQISQLLPHPLLLRPPGAQDEREFLRRCVRCSQCMKVCPTAGLQPCLDEAGLGGVGTPRLVPRLGYCDYSCNACGQTCPTGAIPALSLEEKRQVALGKAYVDRNRCRPWAGESPCIVCEEMCPVPTKAIRLIEETVLDVNGNDLLLQKPHVLPDLCIGCGICEQHCPMPGPAAIRVQRG